MRRFRGIEVELGHIIARITLGFKKTIDRRNILTINIDEQFATVEFFYRKGSANESFFFKSYESSRENKDVRVLFDEFERLEYPARLLQSNKKTKIREKMDTLCRETLGGVYCVDLTQIYGQ